MEKDIDVAYMDQRLAYKMQVTHVNLWTVQINKKWDLVLQIYGNNKKGLALDASILTPYVLLNNI